MCVKISLPTALSDPTCKIKRKPQINRIGANDKIESGTSLAVGSEFLIKNKNQSDIFSFDIGTVFREEENKNLPSNITLRNSQSDIVGGLTFSGIENWKISNENRRLD